MPSNAVHIATRIAVHAIAYVATRITVQTTARITTVYMNVTKRHREAVFVNLCTLLYLHSHPHNRAKPWIPRHQWFHNSSDAWTLGPDAHAAETVMQLPIQTNSQSLQCIHLGSASRNCDISKGHMEDAKQIRLTNGLRLCPGLTRNLG